uniref:Uncharacterized protein n=1 Tax=Daphnia galeata TaxID=27404 RepID=A0A8J2RCY4_9CRUS|nr:unnamed protein product [Daphnia galeata]
MEKDQRLSLSLVFNLVLALEKTRACTVPVLLQVQRELLDYHGTGISVMEMSHRSPEFMKIVTDAQQNIRHLL